jgi:FKBP-type peptidyl-prolyl cis-trans isomerase FkpA
VFRQKRKIIFVVKYLPMRSLFFRSVFFLFFAALFPFAAVHAQDAKSVSAQKAADDQQLQEYFKKNNIQPLKGPGGIYYTITKAGSGRNILAGETVTIDYTGKFLDGKAFDSNTDPAFQHLDPLVFEVGTGRVIRGWDKGLQLLKKGSVATLYIPSGMAYGSAARGRIPANSILVFDISVTDVSK